MRILIATDQWSPDTIGGSARVAADTARALVARGHSVTAIVPAQTDRVARTVEDGVDVLRVLRRHHVPQTFADPVSTRRNARRLTAPFDVLVGHQSTTAVGLGSAMPQLPLVLVFHASAVLESRYLRTRVDRHEQLKIRALDPVVAGLERRSVRLASAVLTLSAFSRGLLVERHPDSDSRCHQVGGGVDPAFFATPAEPASLVRARHGIADGEIFLLTTRRLDPRMGLEELLGALAATGDRRLTLAITGDGGQRALLEALARSLAISDRVHFLGRVSERELRALYASADLFVLPTVAYEGFGMSTVEALASGTPVLGTAVGATPEILAPLGEAFIVPRADAPSLAEGLRRVIPLLTPELRTRCSDRARAEYSWEKAILPWEAVLESAIDDGPVPGNL